MGVIYKQWHPEVERKISEGALEKYSVPDRQIIFFNDRSWHQGTMAVKSGWRWFGRISWGSGRVPTNEIRRQVQVYLEYPMEGW